MKKLALSMTFEEWYNSRYEGRKNLKGNLSEDIVNLGQLMVLCKLLPQLNKNYAFIIDEKKYSNWFMIKVLENNYLYSIGYYVIDCDNNVYESEGFKDENHSKVNAMKEVIADLFAQMLAYYEKYNIGTGYKHS